MKFFNWSSEKNEKLKRERNISFEEIVVAINEGFLREVFEHPDKDKYPNQKIYAVEWNDYVYLIPFIEFEQDIFLKTIIPSRKATKKHKIKGGKK